MESQKERRRHSRYTLRDGAFAGSYPCIGEIIDISSGGILFNYMDFPSHPASSKEFVVCGDDGCCLDEIPFVVISDKIKTNESSFSQIVTRECRIKFGDLDNGQQELLEHFILSHMN